MSSIMPKLLIILFISLGFNLYGQESFFITEIDTTQTKKKIQESPFKTGYYPMGFFDFDLRYLIKYNNYEGIRLGIGGITNDRLFENFEIGGYFAAGIKDQDFKYSLGGNYRINKNGKTWVSIYYNDDIREIGTYAFLTDARTYSVFEPRLLNITQFYKYQELHTNVQHEFSSKFFTELQVSLTAVDQIENYYYIKNRKIYQNYQLTELTASFRFNPKTQYFTYEDGSTKSYNVYPKITAQITQGIKGAFKSEFSYTKFGVKVDYLIKKQDLSSTHILLEGDFAFGDIPLTHLFHAYPNSPTKDEILQRFSIAGRRSFETMYFGEFFSDKLATLQVKHSLSRFKISARFRPQLVFITRHAIGNLKDPQDHLGIEFDTLNNIYSESGLELNNLALGFGMSFAYRYGYYHLSNFADNISFKFTFYPKF